MTPEADSAEMRRIHSIEVEDELKARLLHEHGFEGTLDINWAVKGHPVQSHSILVKGELGMLTATDRQLVITTPAGRRVISEGDVVRSPFSLTPHYHGHGYYGEVGDFISCIREDALTPEIGFDEGYAVQRYMEALYRSGESREPVALEEVP